ncbi:MAG: M43 family zinc metalloprotease [Bacteroidetes bacterium]|nr:M43 family zinc metalloprotease [Bacteroidota bacterium]
MRLLKNICSLSLIMLSAAINNSNAQSGCGFDEELKKSIEADPSKKLALEKFNAQMQNFSKGNQVLGGQVNYVIPVVVHIIHDNGISNVSDAQVKDAIRILNEDFQKRNADTSLIASAFIPIIADIGIEFRLANIDPNGNCTNGITRTFSYATKAGDGSAAKALISWDTQKYYNIWVVDYLESGGNAVGGYSYLPGTAPSSEKEGSIVIHRQFGGIGSSYGSPLSKATVTHETGHFLGLYHTWGIYSSPGTVNACGDDDGISDTPNTTGTVGSCNTNQMSCGVLDNVQNFMDYSSCPYMFTTGQKTKMVNAVNSAIGYRSALWAANNLIATGVNDGYVKQECKPKAYFYSSKKLFCAADTVAFYDKSYNDTLSTHRSWEWTFEGGTPSSSTEQNPIISYNDPGAFKVKLKVTNSSGADSLEKTAYIETFNNDMKQTIYFTEGFESSTFPANSDSSKNWHISSPGAVKFTRNTLAKTEGSASLSVDLHSDTECSHMLISPNFDLSAATKPINFTFDFAYAQKNSSNNDLLKVYYSLDCGKSWLVKTTKNASTLKTKEPTSSNFIPSSSEWNSLVLNFDSYVGQPNFRIKMQAEAKGGNKLYLDNIKFFHGNVGISNIASQNFNAVVYPNPIDETSVLIVEAENLAKIRVELHDVLGRNLLSLSNLNSNTVQLNQLFPKMESGIYFLKIFNGVEIKTISILF